ncbi:MAG: ribonuclease HII [Oscillospiraceae bacterium]|nr:ribonuclease HII [Oscillospiraceae bacterium]
MTDLLSFEQEYWAQGIANVCGIDEAGRGPLAGPVCAAAVILPEGVTIDGLNDSKKLTDKRRRELFPFIAQQALAYGVGFASEQEIDQINILQATFLAMRRALEQLRLQPGVLLVDGNRDPMLGVPTQTIIGGDGKSANIAAASILAKVTRDDYMEQMALRYPEYGFEVHKGYGTKRHYAAIAEYGMCPIHRRSFLKKFYGKS